MNKNNKDFIIKVLKRQIKDLQQYAFVDKKTGCKNRNWLDKFKKEYTDIDCMVCMIDINGLKQINDTHGHDAGDNYIQFVVTKIKDLSKNVNYKLVRLGGDEFVLLFKDTTEKDCKEIYNYFNHELNKVASIGYDFSKCGQTIFSSLKKADAMMYDNKDKFYTQEYKNRVRRVLQ